MSAHDTHDGAVHVHVASWKLYVGILGALLLLTALTVAVYQVHLGAANLAIAVLIATVKASLVVLYFMHLKYDTRFNALVFIGALLFMGLFLAYTLADTEYRGSVDPQYGTKIDPSTGEVAQGMDSELAEQIKAAEAQRLAAERSGVRPPEQPVPVLQVVPQAPTPAPATAVADGGVTDGGGAAATDGQPAAATP